MMDQCRECKFYQEQSCTWWLNECDPEGEEPDCFLPTTLEEYPRIPRLQPYPNENGRCRYCGEELTGRKTAYCSNAHALTYSRRFWWQKVRLRILRRDQDKCVKCGTELDYGESEIDHIQAVVLGGAYWDYDNLQTLCVQCHKRKTKNDFYLMKVKTDLKNVPLLITFFDQNRSDKFGHSDL